jgi:RNA polymerase sigma factor (TIGR02999 family)
MEQTRNTVARLLENLQGGDPAAPGELFTVLYAEIRKLARRQRARWQGNYTLNTTALVHEAYLKLVDQDRVDVESRAHFHALAARAIRHILCSYARERGARKRGGGLERLTLDELKLPADGTGGSDEQWPLLGALDEALQRLEQIDARQAKVVECRFFGGLTIEETAIALEVSSRTVKRDWAMAQAWLHRELTERS